MAYKQLFVWVEGPDDFEFFARIVRPILSKKYDSVHEIQYAKRSKIWVGKYLRSIEAMGADFLFVTDLDRFPCVTERLQAIEQLYPRCGRAKTQVVVREIESWYLAGIGDEDGQQLRLPSLPSTDSLTKEQFNQIIPAQYRSRRDFMSELLQRFSLQTAVLKNHSFAYFARKYGLLDWQTAVS